MNREEYVKICATCTHKKMDAKQGLICSITNAKADFDKECLNFNRDIIETEKMIYRELRANESGTIIPIIGDTSESSASYGSNVTSMNNLGFVQIIVGVMILVASLYLGFSLIGMLVGLGLIISGIVSLQRASNQERVNIEIEELTKNKDQE